MAATEISTAQAARILRISTYEVRQLIVKRKIKAERNGASPWRVDYSSVIELRNLVIGIRNERLKAARNRK
jgi:excisionase family DNA binding protein